MIIPLFQLSRPVVVLQVKRQGREAVWLGAGAGSLAERETLRGA